VGCRVAGLHRTAGTPSKNTTALISLPMSGSFIRGTIKKRRQVNSPYLLICILILQVDVKTRCPRMTETFFAIDTNFAKLIFAMAMLQFLDFHSSIFSSKKILSPFIEGKGNR
jgi:hypothetical protein